MDYEKDTAIDESALDVEWLQQPMLMLRYSKYAADARRAMDLAKERLDLVKAKLDAEIRRDPAQYGIDKVTEAAVSSAILQQPEYQNASQAYIDAKYEYEVAQAAIRAVDTKKTALENLVRLLGMSYFAGPQAPRDISAQWQEKVKETKRREDNRLVRIRRQP